MQAAGNLVAPAAEFAARMQHRQANFHRGAVHLRVKIDREAAPVIQHARGTVGVQGDGDFGAVACQRFVDGVIYNFINQVIQTAHIGGADIHARPFSYGLQSLEHLNLSRVIMMSLLGHGATSLRTVDERNKVRRKTPKKFLWHTKRIISYFAPKGKKKPPKPAVFSYLYVAFVRQRQHLPEPFGDGTREHIRMRDGTVRKDDRGNLLALGVSLRQHDNNFALVRRAAVSQVNHPCAPARLRAIIGSVTLSRKSEISGPMQKAVISVPTPGT